VKLRHLIMLFSSAAAPLSSQPNQESGVPIRQAIGLRVEQSPELFPVGAFVAGVMPEAATQTGLPVGLPVIAGLGDGQAAGLGVCSVSPGDAYLNLGTAIVFGGHGSIACFRAVGDDAHHGIEECIPETPYQQE